MISKIKSINIRYVSKMVNSIAFLPTAVALGLFLLAIFLIDLDSRGEMKKILNDLIPFLVINNSDTARTILSTLIGGVISLTVFSFSMVMITLNQASANFSPRLLPGLISEKKNQFVLGFYLGTIIFNLIVLISVLPSGKSYTLNVLSILVGIILGILSLSLFIYFIHNISSRIQIDNILRSIFTNTRSLIEDSETSDELSTNGEFSNIEWFVIHSDRSGYFDGYNKVALLSTCEKLEINLIIDIKIGQFIMPNSPIIRVQRFLNENEEKSVLNHLFYNHKNDVKSHYAYGIRQITEVGIKSMSPGINDPTTALITLDYLSVLFMQRMKIEDLKIFITDNNKFYLKDRSSSFNQLLNECYASFRIYASHDVMIMKKLLKILTHLLNQDSRSEQYLINIQQQIAILTAEAKNNIKNKNDLKEFIALTKI